MFAAHRRPFITLTAVLVAVIVIFAAAILIPAWQARYHASRLLICLFDLHPGITTEAHARAQLKPLSRYELSFAGHDRGTQFQEVSYAFYNISEPASKVADVLPLALAQRLTLPWTAFKATVRYQDGLLSNVHILEMQEDIPGGPHPNSASTSILSTRFGQQIHYMPPVPSGFNGYSVYTRNTSGVDANGNSTGFNCCYARFITLDERATPVQLADSLNFQLRCLTSWRRCKDDRQILP